MWAWGYQADIAHDGPTALKLAEQKPYALAIIDYEMPGIPPRVELLTVRLDFCQPSIRRRECGTLSLPHSCRKLGLLAR
jgi:CheY-like chemotaxis protein